MFAEFREQDSGCLSFGVELPGGARWFVKTATTDAAAVSLERGWEFHRAVTHPAVVRPVHRGSARGRPVVAAPWYPGEVLYGRAAERRLPGSPMSRFRALAVPEVLRAVERVVAAHVAVEAAGFVAVDLYDGSLLHDFAGRTLRLVDLDEYRPGPFVLDADRLPGSTRIMAPEQAVRGSTIDTRTTVFMLGRLTRLLLDAGDDEDGWRGGTARLDVVRRATEPDPGRRFPTVAGFAAAWRTASAGKPR